MVLANVIDGEDFINFELAKICQVIPHFKIRKRFLTAWSKETKEVLKRSNYRIPGQLIKAL